MPHLLVISVLLGNVSVDKFLGFCNLLCSNSWNGAFFCQYYPFQGKIKKIIVVTFSQMAEIYLLAYLVILPFLPYSLTLWWME